MNKLTETAESVVQIDEHNLDKECIRLPTDYLKYAHLAAEAKRDVDELKASLDLVEARLGNGIRQTPGQYGLEKVTESAVANTILLQKEHQQGLEALLEAKHNQEMAQAVVWALEHKKRSLTLLVELHGMGYFANVKVSREGKAAVEEMTKTKVRRFRADED